MTIITGDSVTSGLLIRGEYELHLDQSPRGIDVVRPESVVDGKTYKAGTRYELSGDTLKWQLAEEGEPRRATLRRSASNRRRAY